MKPQNKSSEKESEKGLDWKAQLENIKIAGEQIERPSIWGLVIVESVFIAIFLAVAVGIYFALFMIVVTPTQCDKSLVVAITVLGIVVICTLGIVGYVILSNAAAIYKSEMDVYNKYRQAINDLRIKALK